MPISENEPQRILIVIPYQGQQNFRIIVQRPAERAESLIHGGILTGFQLPFMTLHKIKKPCGIKPASLTCMHESQHRLAISHDLLL